MILELKDSSKICQLTSTAALLHLVDDGAIYCTSQYINKHMSAHVFINAFKTFLQAQLHFSITLQAFCHCDEGIS